MSKPLETEVIEPLGGVTQEQLDAHMRNEADYFVNWTEEVFLQSRMFRLMRSLQARTAFADRCPWLWDRLSSVVWWMTGR